MIATLFYKFKEWIIGAGVILAAIATIYAKGRRAGKESVREANRKELAKDVQSQNKIKQDVANDSNAELDERLRRWQR